MCWIGKPQDKRIAEDDIIVYKVFKMSRLDTNKLFTIYGGYLYEEGKTYSRNIIPVTDSGDLNRIIIENGIHCYSKKCKFLRYDESDLTMRRASTVHVKFQNEPLHYEIGTVHNYTEDMYYYPVVAKCVIPEGTKYYINYLGEIVTEQLTIEYVTKI